MKFLLMKLSSAKVVAILVCAVITVMYVYLLSMHRVQSLNDIASTIQILRQDTVTDRCKALNSTHFRCLPNVLFIGASKCGTTSMVDYLSQHGNIHFVGRRIHNADHHKEVHRFDRNTFGYAMTFVDLLDEWASSPVVTSTDATVIHYTPHYLYAPTVPYTVRTFYPDYELKFIVMLRDPVDRALSSYWFHNSHLFHEQDQGSIEEFINMSVQDISKRLEYEQCMDRHLSTSTPTLSANTNTSSSEDTIVYHLDSFINKEYVHANTYTNITRNTKNRRQSNTRANSNKNANHIQSSTNLLFSALIHCYGAHLRSPSLGHRHIDKSIYIDQIIRWLDAGFQLHQFHFISLSDMKQYPELTFQKILDFTQVQPTTANANANTNEQSINAVREGQIRRGKRHMDTIIDTISFNKRRLERPNKLASLPQNQLNMTIRLELEKFYKPYNEKLFRLLGRTDLF